MKFRTIMAAFCGTALLTGGLAFAQDKNEGRGQAVVTVLPARANEVPASLNQQDLSVKVNGKDSTVVNWMPLRGMNDRLELVVLIDSGVRSSMNAQLSDISSFVNSLPPNAKVSIAYMENGMARLSGPLTTDHDQALKGLHVAAGLPGEDASPYFCLSDLAKRWPSNDRGARREVLMITDGVDNYNRRYDPNDPYVQAAIADSVRAGLVVYAIYFQNKGRFDSTLYANNAGQNLIGEVTQATGGKNYWEGVGNPVSFQPFLQDLQRRLQNQYELSFTAPLKDKPEVADLKLKINGIAGKVDAPQQVYVSRAM